MGEPHYRAYCKECGCTVRTGEHTKFMSPFFLPERCPKCHRSHSRYSYSWDRDCLYVVEFGFWEFVPAPEQPPKVWFLPWTWGVVGQEVWRLWREPARTVL